MNRRDLLRAMVGYPLGVSAGLLIPDKKVWALDRTMLRPNNLERLSNDDLLAIEHNYTQRFSYGYTISLGTGTTASYCWPDGTRTHVTGDGATVYYTHTGDMIVSHYLQGQPSTTIHLPIEGWKDLV